MQKEAMIDACVSFDKTKIDQLIEAGTNVSVVGEFVFANNKIDIFDFLKQYGSWWGADDVCLAPKNGHKALTLKLIGEGHLRVCNAAAAAFQGGFPELGDYIAFNLRDLDGLDDNQLFHDMCAWAPMESIERFVFLPIAPWEGIWGAYITKRKEVVTFLKKKHLVPPDDGMSYAYKTRDVPLSVEYLELGAEVGINDIDTVPPKSQYFKDVYDLIKDSDKILFRTKVFFANRCA